jgi:hypothetical protein
MVQILKIKEDAACMAALCIASLSSVIIVKKFKGLHTLCEVSEKLIL